MSEVTQKRPEFRNINAFKDLTTYRLPAAGIVSILHRVSGLLMFLLLPFVILWILVKVLPPWQERQAPATAEGD